MPDEIEPLEISSIGITLDPKSVTIDKEGRLSIANAQALQAILSARPRIEQLRPNNGEQNDQNAINCNASGCNAYSCK